MDQYIQTGLGIIVSLILFLIGYKQTIGAKRERIKSANKKIIDIILKRIILEEYTPLTSDVERLTEGVARDYKINKTELMSLDIINSMLFTRIFENDLISKEQRMRDIERLSAVFITKDNNKRLLDQQFNYVSNEKKQKLLTITSLLLGITSVLIGTMVPFFDSVLTSIPNDINMILITAGASFATIYIAYLFIKIKNNQEDDKSVSNSDYIKDAVKFEEKVIAELNKYNASFSLLDRKDQCWDFTININDEPVAVEIKFWRNRPPLSYVKRIVEKINSAMEKTNINRGYILVNNAFDLYDRVNNDNLKIISLADFIKIIHNK